ncbi:tRNA dimethylallyltransferase [Methyloligella halotolerans]|uniref:tRNA dimethylallyltransferase n=1 Tax=Methyloligella halotolerans TaxID=1177755 RepID=A0A1E2S3G8_9HYPH|nr:tRNA (adenosine(37)-N6)-dimethylallyltransferase MiaA [Methyloligella halotolerans]ODA68981.1 tRNA dimethylallyltransferase [Methyloligella halotolerans]
MLVEDRQSGSDIAAVLLAGPTASGKSAAALELAARFGGVIVNADSMQVYEELRILTARPNLDEERLVPHRLYGTVSAAERYSVGRWLKDVAAILSEEWERGRLPILTGGTGLYFKALTEGLADTPEIPSAIRERWEAHAGKLSVSELHEELAACDPVMAERLVPSDRQRIVRALEIVDATGVSLAEWQAETQSAVLPPQRTLQIVVAPDRSELYAKIDRRFDAMIALGALDEVRAVAALDLPMDLPAMRAHGVPDLLAALKGEVAREEAIEKAKTMSRRYAKRQLTWARRFMADWHWVENSADAVTFASARLADRMSG